MMVWHDTRTMNILANAIYSLVMLILLIFGVWWLSQRPMFTIRQIQIEPIAGSTLEYVTVPNIRNSDVLKQKGNFFTLNLDTMRESFEAVPWIRRSRVRREWPNRLIITIEEYRAFALWGDNQLISRDAEIFQANIGEAEANGNLPQLRGPVGTEKKVVKLYIQLSEKLKKVNLTIDELELTDRYAWQLTLNNGSEIALGQNNDPKQFEQRIDRLIQIYPELVKRYGEVASVDLRYATGLAFKAKGVHVVEEAQPKTNNKPKPNNKPKVKQAVIKHQLNHA